MLEDDNIAAEFILCSVEKMLRRQQNFGPLFLRIDKSPQRAFKALPPPDDGTFTY